MLSAGDVPGPQRHHPDPPPALLPRGRGAPGGGKAEAPVVQNPCPANGSTRRQEVKELFLQLEERYPNLRQKIFGAMQRYPLYGWNLEEMEK